MGGGAGGWVGDHHQCHNLIQHVIVSHSNNNTSTLMPQQHNRTQHHVDSARLPNKEGACSAGAVPAAPHRADRRRQRRKVPPPRHLAATPPRHGQKCPSAERRGAPPRPPQPTAPAPRRLSTLRRSHAAITLAPRARVHCQHAACPKEKLPSSKRWPTRQLLRLSREHASEFLRAVPQFAQPLLPIR